MVCREATIIHLAVLCLESLFIGLQGGYYNTLGSIVFGVIIYWFVGRLLYNIWQYCVWSHYLLVCREATIIQ